MVTPKPEPYLLAISLAAVPMCHSKIPWPRPGKQTAAVGHRGIEFREEFHSIQGRSGIVVFFSVSAGPFAAATQKSGFGTSGQGEGLCLFALLIVQAALLLEPTFS